MANNQKIDSIISENVEVELKNMITLLKESHSLVLNTPKITSLYKSADGLADIKKAYTELEASNKKLLDMQKQFEVQSQRLADVEKKLAEVREKNSKANKERTDEEIRASVQQREETKRRTDAIRAESDAYKQLTLQYNQAAAEAKKLQAEALIDPSKIKAAEDAAKKAKAMWDQLKSIDASVGQHFKNVGNYPESARMIIEALERQRERAERLNKELGNTHPAAQQATRGMEALQRIVDQPQFLNVAAKVGDSNAELKSFTKTLIELERQGLGKTDFATELRKHLAELKDQIDDTRSEIKKLSSDSHAFDEFANAVSFAASSYQTFSGVQALVGEQNEEVEESIKKLVAIQNVANGVQQIAKQLTEQGTIVNKAYAFVQTQLAIATNASATATARLNAAFKLSTIGLVIGAVAVLVTKWNDWFGTSKKVLDQQKALDDYNGKIANSFVDQKSALDDLIAPLNNHNTSLSEKKRIVKELQEQYPNYLGNIRLEKGEVVGLAEGYNKLVKAIELKTRSQAAGELLKEQEKEAMKLGLQYGVTTWEQAEKIYQKYKGTNSYIIGSFVQAYENVKNTREALKGIQVEADKALQALGGDPTGGQQQFKDQKKKQEDAAKEAQEIEKRNLKAKFELYKLDKDKQLENLQLIIDDENATYAERVLAAINYVEIKQKLIAEVAAFEIKINKSTKDEAALIDKQAYYDKIKVAEDTQKKLEEISNKAKDKKAASATEIFTNVPESSIYKQIIKSLDDYQKKQAEVSEKEKQYHQERKERLSELASQIKETTASIIEGSFEKQKNVLAERQNMNDKAYEKEVENIRNSTLSEEDKANRLKVLEVAHVAQKEQTDRKIRAIEERKAKFERAKNIADIIQSTSVAIVKTLAAYPGPQGVALSIIEGAIGAAALVKAVATQIPKYFRGRKKSDPYEGPALAGEVRPELMRKSDGSLHLIDKPTIVDVERGDEIFPDAKEAISKLIPFEEVNKILLQSMMANTVRMMNPVEDKTSIEVSKMRSDMKEFFVWQTSQLKEAYQSKKPININIHPDWKNSEYVRRSVKE